MEPNQRKIAPEGLIPVTDIDVKSLASVYEERDVYISIYLPMASSAEVHDGRSFVETRAKAIEKALPKDMKRPFEETLAMAEEALCESSIPGEKGIIIFASAPHSFLHTYRIGLAPERTMVLDTSPFLLPLARLRDDYEDYGILLLDSREAKLFCIRSDVPEERAHLSTDLMNKHKKGGWSQMRFNRLRKGAIKTFLTKVVTDIEECCRQEEIRGLVIAGPGDAKHQLEEMLPNSIMEKVLGVADLPIDASWKELVQKGDEITLKDERSRSKARAEELKAAILKGKPAAQGVEDVRDALNQGRANVLILLKDLSIPGWICERCQNLDTRTKMPLECPKCGGTTSRVDLVEELYELAQRTGAEVEFVEEDSCLKSIGGIGALLRY